MLQERYVESKTKLTLPRQKLKLREKTDGAMGIKKKVKSNKNPKSLKKKRKRSKRTIKKSNKYLKTT